MNKMTLIITLPVIAGLLLFTIPERYRIIKGSFAVLIGIITFWISILLYRTGGLSLVPGSGVPPAGVTEILHSWFGGTHSYFVLNNDHLSKLIILFISLFALLILFYSLIANKRDGIKNYYEFFLLTLGCSSGAVLSDNLLLFLFFWGVLGITLYKMIYCHNEECSAAAKKTLILIGASDSIMLIGIALLWKMTGSLSMSAISVHTSDILSTIAFLALLTGSFTKMGAFPLHTWVPDYAENAPATSSAFLPASVDKLLGIYFLARLTTKVFILNEWMTLLLLTAGTVTIIIAVMMALVQHDSRRLLGYHAVSQAGYMILGFGLGSAIGVAAGLFHLLNNALYKCGLFLVSGSVSYRTGKNNLDDLGGLSKAMPVTFLSSLIFAMSISGIPPFNGFASKWMIYQGIIDFGRGASLANKL
jgi:formate hydrogenlyase subunit 3/multisubunit Na+/H+ antiporter MnhD subunit